MLGSHHIAYCVIAWLFSLSSLSAIVSRIGHISCPDELVLLLLIVCGLALGLKAGSASLSNHISFVSSISSFSVFESWEIMLRWEVVLVACVLEFLISSQPFQLQRTACFMAFPFSPKVGTKQVSRKR